MAIVDVLKFDSGADVFAWKYPNSELGTWTQLIVNESQEAILVKNGQVTDIFGPGRYTLSTDNIPGLRRIVNIPFGGRSPFTAEVWFINRACALDIKWGTSTPIQVLDPKYKVFIPVRAFGQFGIKIDDSQRFLTKLVGTMKFFNRNTLTDYFRGLYVTRVKDSISSCLVKGNISILEINAHLNEISESLQKELSERMENYGIQVISFYVNDISAPENDPAVKQLKSALAKRAEMDIIGYSYQQERAFDTLETAADNHGVAGSVMGAGMGLGMGFGIGGAMGNQAQNLSGAMNSQKACPACGKQIDEKMRFCPECGADTSKKAEKPILCSSCGKEVGKGIKFCPECGHKMNLCPACGADMPDGSTSCPACGAGRCPQCGNSIPAGAKFCPECGFTARKVCPGCGAEITGSTKFCTECGTKI